MDITKKMSPNKYNGRNGWKPDIIVCHITESSYDSAINTLCNPASEASSHFVVAKDGRIAQLVDLTDSAWCNGTSTNPEKNTYYGKSTLVSVRERKTNANYYTISIEHEGIFEQTKGKLTDAQLKATIELISWIRSEIKRIYNLDIPLNREHIVGHCQITPVTKPNCPGYEFQFDKIIKQIKQEGEEMKIVLVPSDSPDVNSAQILGSKYHLPVVYRGDVRDDEIPIQIGGSGEDVKPGCKKIYGNNRIETFEAVLKELKGGKLI